GDVDRSFQIYRAAQNAAIDRQLCTAADALDDLKIEARTVGGLCEHDVVRDGIECVQPVAKFRHGVDGAALDDIGKRECSQSLFDQTAEKMTVAIQRKTQRFSDNGNRLSEERLIAEDGKRIRRSAELLANNVQ